MGIKKLEYDKPRQPPRLSEDDLPIVPPPSTMSVDFERWPVLYLPNGQPLTRKIGF